MTATVAANGKEVNGNALSIVFNNCYLNHGKKNVFLTVEDLLRFASQAANGMVSIYGGSLIFFFIYRFTDDSILSQT